jgi:hypothetical protein
MIKRYSIPTEKIAKELILLLSDEINPTVTEFTHGIVCLGFQDKRIPILDADWQPTYDADGMPLVDVIKGMTYDVDIFWKAEPLEAFNEFEVEPKTPNHNFM